MLNSKMLGKAMHDEAKKLSITAQNINDPHESAEKIWQSIAKAIVDHILKNAEVTVVGVQSGTGSAIGKIT